ncbi:RNA polymerase sigma factor [Cellulomonas phragmiteti]|uniref:DNA-directed RNA polymerase sigma-70 factor n=1 Tax=Cellulomonas phragmiteti TaxID=478780 RepID=A0ABQ4DIN7_9CELL|nr:sigma-70 family RNA polymerase sigma factor [Cellulomonas phragmiteti]GIG39197.1 DNA-directed RNA polymerase sigma-70 factor [Cellulomonas phragmiteti]
METTTRAGDAAGDARGRAGHADAAREVPGPSTWDVAATAFRSWRDGAPGAMDELVTAMTPVLWHVVRAYGLERGDAQDVVQTTWLTLVRRAESIADPQAVAAWLTTTARREAWRVARRRAPAVVVTDDVLEFFADPTDSAEQQAVRHDTDDLLWRCVRSLSERCRRLLRVVAFDDRPDYARISRDLGMAVGSIGPTRGRCLARLRQTLLAAGGAP